MAAHTQSGSPRLAGVSMVARAQQDAPLSPPGRSRITSIKSRARPTPSSAHPVTMSLRFTRVRWPCRARSCECCSSAPKTVPVSDVHTHSSHAQAYTTPSSSSSASSSALSNPAEVSSSATSFRSAVDAIEGGRSAFVPVPDVEAGPDMVGAEQRIPTRSNSCTFLEPTTLERGAKGLWIT